MDELDARVEVARDIAEAVLDKATRRLMAGAEMAHVHERYTVAATELLEEVELQAVLAAGGDDGALALIDDLVEDLKRLRVTLEEEAE